MRAAAEQEKSRIGQWNPGTYWTPGLGSSALPQVTGLARIRLKIVKVFEFSASTSEVFTFGRELAVCVLMGGSPTG